MRKSPKFFTLMINFLYNKKEFFIMKTVTSLLEFNKLLKESGQKPVVVDFHATWCGPCKMIAPMFESLDRNYNSAIVFVKVDVDEANDIAEKYKVSALPTFMVFWDMKPTKTVTGANTKVLERLVESLL
jgi:thioredoxin 1